MKKTGTPSKLRASVLEAEQLLALASDLDRSKRLPPSRTAVVQALQEWVGAVEKHASALEAKLKVIAPKLTLAELQSRLQRAKPILAPRPDVPPPSEGAHALMLHLVRSRKAPSPVVWLLATNESGGIAVYEQSGDGTPPGAATELIGREYWVRRTDGVWQQLDYAAADSSTFQVCVFWKGLEDVSITSAPAGDWTSTPWEDDGERVGTKFCSSFPFANMPGGGVIDVTINVKRGPSHTFQLRVDNAHAAEDRGNGNGLPEPILTPTKPTDPPTGPGPILIPNDLTTLPGIDPRDVGRILELFESFRIEAERARPRIVRDALNATQLLDDQGAALGSLLEDASLGLLET
ncbi:MAG: hypothetical protein ACRBN8_03595 [Nannocystales bacterium]